MRSEAIASIFSAKTQEHVVNLFSTVFGHRFGEKKGEYRGRKAAREGEDRRLKKLMTYSAFRDVNKKVKVANDLLTDHI